MKQNDNYADFAEGVNGGHIFHVEKHGKVGADQKTHGDIAQDDRKVYFAENHADNSGGQKHHGQVDYERWYVHRTPFVIQGYSEYLYTLYQKYTVVGK